MAADRRAGGAATGARASGSVASGAVASGAGSLGLDRAAGVGNGCGVPPVDAHAPLNTAQQRAMFTASFISASSGCASYRRRVGRTTDAANHNFARGLQPR